MDFKEKLLKLKNMMSSSNVLTSRDYEFDALLENHPIPDNDVYRLYYVDYHRIREYPGRSDNNIGTMHCYYKPFMLPKGMTREEGFKILSYLTDFIEKRDDIEPCSLKFAETLNGVLDLERFGFNRTDENDENKILNLFIVSGRLLLFKESRLYQKYFDWYIDNVTLEEVVTIYAKHNMEFRDIVWSDKESRKKYLKVKEF